MAVIIVVVIVLVGLVGWKMLGSKPSANDSKAPPGATVPPSQRSLQDAMQGHTPPAGARR